MFDKALYQAYALVIGPLVITSGDPRGFFSD